MKPQSAAVACVLVPFSLLAGFASTETYLPAVGRVPGKNGAEFYTTVWATNLTSAPQTFTFQFLKTGQSPLPRPERRRRNRRRRSSRRQIEESTPRRERLAGKMPSKLEEEEG